MAHAPHQNRSRSAGRRRTLSDKAYDPTHFAAPLIGIAAHSVAHFGHEHLTWVREHRTAAKTKLEARMPARPGARARAWLKPVM